MNEIRWGRCDPQAGAVATLLAPPRASAGEERLPGRASVGAGGATGLAFAGSIAGASTPAGCASAAFGGPADLVVLVALVAGLARLRPRDRARAQGVASTHRRARRWQLGER